MKKMCVLSHCQSEYCPPGQYSPMKNVPLVNNIPLVYAVPSWSGMLQFCSHSQACSKNLRKGPGIYSSRMHLTSV